MAAHLNALHISSSYTQHSLASEDVMEVVVDPTAPVTTTSISEKLKGHTIVLSDDVKKIQDEPIIPASLIERYMLHNMTYFQVKFNIQTYLNNVLDSKLHDHC